MIGKLYNIEKNLQNGFELDKLEIPSEHHLQYASPPAGFPGQELLVEVVLQSARMLMPMEPA